MDLAALMANIQVSFAGSLFESSFSIPVSSASFFIRQ